MTVKAALTRPGRFDFDFKTSLDPGTSSEELRAVCAQPSRLKEKELLMQIVRELHQASSHLKAAPKRWSVLGAI